MSQRLRVIVDQFSGRQVSDEVHGFGPREELPPLPDGQVWGVVPSVRHILSRRGDFFEPVERPTRPQPDIRQPLNMADIQNRDEALAYIRQRGIESVMVELLMGLGRAKDV